MNRHMTDIHGPLSLDKPEDPLPVLPAPHEFEKTVKYFKIYGAAWADVETARTTRNGYRKGSANWNKWNLATEMAQKVLANFPPPEGFNI